MTRPLFPSRYQGMELRQQVQQQLYKVLRGGISFGDGTNTDNINGCWVTVVSPASPNTEFAVTHTLLRIPVGFDIKNKNKAGDVYSSTTPWTTTKIYLKCDVASVTLTLFIH